MRLCSFVSSKVLVWTYTFITMVAFPITIYAVSPISHLWWHEYAIVVVYVFTAGAVTAEGFAAIDAARKQQEMSDALEKKTKQADFEAAVCSRRIKMAIIVPAYMNNEVDIIHDTLSAYEKAEGKNLFITVWLIFNMRNPSQEIIDKVAVMTQEWDGKVSGNVSFKVHNNETSRSKCDNVNRGLELIPPDTDYVGIFDADHEPLPDNFMQAVHSLQKCDIVQGHCSIRNFDDNLLTKMVAVEFEDIYNTGHEGRTALFHFGVFGGSNGIWKYELLNEIKMDGSMLTEDIDSSLRSTLRGATIHYNRNMISAELAPETWGAWLSQRLRWAQGWFQVSMKYLSLGLKSNILTPRQKFAIGFLFFWRELYPYFTFHPWLLIIVYTIRQGYVSGIMLTASTLFCFFMLLVKLIMVYGLANGNVAMFGKTGSEFLIYAAWNLPYKIALNAVHVAAHAQQFLAIDNWVTTPRSSKPADGKPKSAPAVQVPKPSLPVSTSIKSPIHRPASKNVIAGVDMV